MPRFTSKLFMDLFIWMIGVGLLLGACFPLLLLPLGVATQQTLTPAFWIATLAAGLAAGTVNYLLVRRLVKPRLRLLADHMRVVERTLKNATFSGDWSNCDAVACRVTVDSDDEIGESARAFNDLVVALFRSHEAEMAVSDFSRALSSQLELDLLAHQALDQLLRHTGALAGAVLIENNAELITTAEHGLRCTKGLADNDEVRQAMRTCECRKVVLPEDIYIESVLISFRPKEIIVVPIDFKRVPLGVVVLATAQSFTPESAWLLELFRQGFGLALNNALAHDRLQRMAAIDALTGSYNRRFGMTRLHEEFNRALRSRTPLGILMLDVDYFKSVNDTYGHLVGDRALIRMVEASRRSLREGDFMVRYGGEEFLLVLPGASCQDSGEIAERIRRVVAETEVKDGTQVICLTVSLGVTSFPEANVEQVDDLIKYADDALFLAKDQGRNRVIIAC